MKSLNYLSGFHNHFETEALKDALPKGQNSPQKVPYGLYAEQLSGTAFTSLRAENYRTWLYKIRPSVVQGSFRLVPSSVFAGTPWDGVITPPDQMRWKPRPYADQKTNFVESLFCMAGAGHRGQSGCAVYLYACNASMANEFFYSADGEFLIVPEEGAIEVRTELGLLHVSPLEIVVIPRGVKFQINLLETSTKAKARGYVCENFGRPFELPYLGPIGANGLASARDFQTPVAAYEDLEGEFKLFAKFDGYLFEADIGHSPLDTVAWHGNLAPYKYDLRKFNTINTVSYDHPDPSIFTVLTSPSNHVGTANVDFAIFPPRWMVAENTFRPPYFHRNFMNEFMGLIQGVYDAKNESFSPGGSSLHNRMSGHGPDAETFAKASNAVLKPEKIENSMAFMFETGEVLRLTKAALEASFRDHKYQSCWQTLPKNFAP